MQHTFFSELNVDLICCPKNGSGLKPQVFDPLNLLIYFLHLSEMRLLGALRFHDTVVHLSDPMEATVHMSRPGKLRFRKTKVGEVGRI